MAVLLMNNGAEPKALDFAFHAVPKLKAKAGCSIYDVWSRKSLGFVAGPKFTAPAVGPRDSVFITLSGCH